MARDLSRMIEDLRGYKMTKAEMESQRRSFAYGSAKIENDDITRRMIDEAAQQIGPPRDTG